MLIRFRKYIGFAAVQNFHYFNARWKFCVLLQISNSLKLMGGMEKCEKTIDFL